MIIRGLSLWNFCRTPLACSITLCWQSGTGSSLVFRIRCAERLTSWCELRCLDCCGLAVSFLARNCSKSRPTLHGSPALSSLLPLMEICSRLRDSCHQTFLTFGWHLEQTAEVVCLKPFLPWTQQGEWWAWDCSARKSYAGPYCEWADCSHEWCSSYAKECRLCFD